MEIKNFQCQGEGSIVFFLRVYLRVGLCMRAPCQLAEACLRPPTPCPVQSNWTVHLCWFVLLATLASTFGMPHGSARHVCRHYAFSSQASKEKCIVCCRNNIAVSSLTAAAMAKATVGFNDLECRPSKSKIWTSESMIQLKIIDFVSKSWILTSKSWTSKSGTLASKS